MSDIKSIANWFLKKEPMTHKKVQKLCYYAQAWSYALRDRPITDADFQAWVHGPVSPELYKEYAGNGFSDLRPNESVPTDFPPEELELLNSVWETYGESTGNSLEVLTHGELPWINARKGCPSNKICDTSIDVEDMKKYYRSIYLGELEPYA